MAAPLAVAFVVLCFRDLAAGLAAFALLTFFEHFGELAAGSVSAIKGVGLILALAWALLLLDSRRPTPFLLRERPWIAWSVAALLLWAGSSVLWAADSDEVIAQWGRLLQVTVLVFIAYSAVRAVKDLRLLLWAFMIGAFLTGVVGLATGSTDEGTERLTGGISDPNFLAAVIAPSLVLAIFFLLSPGQRPLTRSLLVVFVGVGLLTLVQTESRGGLVAFAAGALVALLVAGRVRGRVLAIVLVAVALGTVYFAIAVSTESRERVTDFSAEGSSGRYDQWQIALRMAGDHPILGAGLGNFPELQPSYTVSDVNLSLVDQLLRGRPVVHNTYLEAAAELGVAALALLVAVWGGAIAVAYGTLRRNAGRIDPGLETGLRALVPAMTALLVAYFFLSGLYEKQVWLLLGAMLAAAGLAERDGATAKLPPAARMSAPAHAGRPPVAAT